MKKIKLLGFAVCALTLAGAVGCGSQSEVPDVPGGNTGDDTQTGFTESYGEVSTPITFGIIGIFCLWSSSNNPFFSNSSFNF